MKRVFTINVIFLNFNFRTRIILIILISVFIGKPTAAFSSMANITVIDTILKENTKPQKKSSYFIEQARMASKKGIDNYESYIDSALFYFEREDQNTINQIEYAHALRSKGIFYIKKTFYDKGLELFFKAEQKYAENKDYKNLAGTYQNIATLNYTLKNYDIAKKYFSLAINIIKEHPSTFKDNYDYSLGEIYMGLGDIYGSLNQGKECLKHYDVAFEYLKKKPNPNLLLLYNNYCYYYMGANNYIKAEPYAIKARDLAEKLHITNAGYFNLAQIYFYTKRYKQAVEQYKYTILISDENTQLSINCLSNKQWSYEGLAKSYEKMGNYKLAYTSLIESNTLKDSLTKKNIYDKTLELQTKFDFNKKELELAKVNAEAKINVLEIAAQKKARKTLIIVITIIILIVIGLLISIYALRNANQKILLKTEQLKRQAVEIAKYQSQMNPHFIFNAMSSIQANVVKNDTKKAIQQIADFSKLMRTTLTNSEHDLITLSEEELFLNHYLNFELRRFNNIIHYSFIYDSDINPSETQIMPMLIQPLIENSLKHAELSKKTDAEIRVTISIKNTELLEVTVSDNGVGFAEKEDEAHISKALKITYERVKLFLRKYEKTEEDCFSFGNQEKGGAEIMFVIPYLKKY